MIAEAKEISRLLPSIIAANDVASAEKLVESLPANSDFWLPEAYMLFNIRGLASDGLIKKIFGHTENGLTLVSARLGAYGFSFPRWRYLTQSFEGVSLVERFGMHRLRRDTDIKDAALPDPHRDLFGAGFFWQDDTHYIEYRRAYIVCSDANGALIIRNNSYFFGRDRLPAPVYVRFGPVAFKELQALTPSLEGFTQWQDILRTPQPDKKISYVSQWLDMIDRFDEVFHTWLRTDGKPHLVSFLRSKCGSPSAPYLGEIALHTPPWFPRRVQPITPDLLLDLDFSAWKGIPVLLSGKNGDFPVI